ncbi:MAG: 16S rRNA (cytosine(1402)-N(4))-methyltransferase RsmH [Candidatus Saccharimonadales bacterium]
MHHKISSHIPVLLEQVLTYLDPMRGDAYLDLTAGYGGHANSILERTKNPTQAVLVDRDQNAIEVLEGMFEPMGVRILQEDFFGASQRLTSEGYKFDVILADLGVASPHLNEASRGFAITADGPLDMRMDKRQTKTAADVVNKSSVAELTDVLIRYGEEPKASLIARLIVRNRPIASTTELARIVARAWPRHSKVHPATRTFQAIRVDVNDELRQLEKSLPLWIDLLKPKGRLAVISFHSLEDRLVKQVFSELSGNFYDAKLQLLIKHPVMASKHEIAFNPRARSAKLRVVAKINT